MPRESKMGHRKQEFQALPASENEVNGEEEEDAKLLAEPVEKQGASDYDDDGGVLKEDPAKLSLCGEAESLFRLALPMVFGQILNMLGWQVNLVLIGHISAEALGASAMARMWMGISAYAILFGGQMSLDTLRSQAYGAKAYEHVGVLTQRGIIIVTLLCIPAGISWIWLTAPVLRLIGVPDEIAEMAQLYCKVAVGNIWPMLAQNMAIGFLRCKYMLTHAAIPTTPWFPGIHSDRLLVFPGQRIVKPLTYLAAATQLITLPVSFYLINTYGFIGGAMAESINGWIMFISTMMLINWKGYHKKCWHGWSMRAFEDWGPIVKLGAAGSLQSFVQMSSFEFTAAMASTLGAVPLAAHSCSSNLTFFMFPVVGTTGLMATTVRVGNLLGEGRPKQARLTGKASVIICTSTVAFCAMLLQVFREDFARIYSGDEEVIAVAASISPQVGGYLIFFGMVMSFRGTVGGCGKQLQSARMGTFTWYCVGLPLGALFCFLFDMGLGGLWAGLCCGGLFQCSCFYIWLRCVL